MTILQIALSLPPEKKGKKGRKEGREKERRIERKETFYWYGPQRDNTLEYSYNIKITP